MDDNVNSNGVSPVNGTDDREACSRFWIAVYTRPRCEKKTCEELRFRGIEVYLPIQRQMRQWSDRKKMIDTVIIPMVVFLCVNREEIPSIKRHPQILRILSLPGEKQPAKIPSEQIERLKYILGQSDISVDFVPDVFKVKDNVRITRGGLMGICGEIRSCSVSHCDLIIPIGLLGGAILTVPKTDIEIIK